MHKPIEVRKTSIEPEIKPFINCKSNHKPKSTNQVENRHSTGIHEANIKGVEDLRIAIFNQKLRT